MNDVYAHITEDGRLAHVATEGIIDPVYGTEAFEAHVLQPLTAAERSLLIDLLGGAGTCVFSQRSGKAQWGFQAFHPTQTHIDLSTNPATVITRITDLRRARGALAVENLRTLCAGGLQPSFGRAVLQPHGALLTANEVYEAKTSGHLPGAHVHEKGTVSYALDPIESVFEGIDDPEVLRKIIAANGSLRTLIDKLRTERQREHAIAPGEFLVGNTSITSERYHVMLRHVMTSNGRPSTMVHGDSRLLEAKRTKGKRQTEGVNTGDVPVQIEGLAVEADILRASPEHLAKTFTQG